MNRWCLFRSPHSSSFAELLQSALDSYDRQVIPISEKHQPQRQDYTSIPNVAPLMALE